MTSDGDMSRECKTPMKWENQVLDVWSGAKMNRSINRNEQKCIKDYIVNGTLITVGLIVLL